MDMMEKRKRRKKIVYRGLMIILLVAVFIGTIFISWYGIASYDGTAMKEELGEHCLLLYRQKYEAGEDDHQLVLVRSKDGKSVEIRHSSDITKQDVAKGRVIGSVIYRWQR